MAHTRQSKPDSGLGFQIKILNVFCCSLLARTRLDSFAGERFLDGSADCFLDGSGNCLLDGLGKCFLDGSGYFFLEGSGERFLDGCAGLAGSAGCLGVPGGLAVTMVKSLRSSYAGECHQSVSCMGGPGCPSVSPPGPGGLAGSAIISRNVLSEWL